MTIKEHKETKLLMTKIITTAKTIRRDAHEFHLHDETFAQMSCLIIFVEKAKVLLKTFDTRQPDTDLLHDLSPELYSLGTVVAANDSDPREELSEAD